MKPKKKNKKLIILILVLIAIIVIVLFVNKKDELPLVGNQRSVDTSTYTNTYSDGWHEFSFKFPADATVGYSLGGLNRGVIAEEGEIPNQAVAVTSGLPSDMDEKYCALELSTLDRQGGDYGSIEVSAPTVELGGMQWKKRKSTSNEGNWLYEYKGVAWQTEKGNFRYVFGANQEDERWCESIISTFRFELDPSVPAAVKAKMAKDVAMQYAASKYPSKILVDGHFLYNTRGDQKLNVLDSTDKVRVAISEPTNRNYENSVGIRLIEQNGEWVVTGEVDPW